MLTLSDHPIPPFAVLMYHAIGQPSCGHEAHYTTPPSQFEAQMRLLRDEGWTTSALGPLLERIRRNQPIPQRTVAITFDDGFACLVDQVGPWLEAGLQATAYVVSGAMDRMARFDTDLGIRARPMISSSALRELCDRGLLEVGSHTINHPDLRRLSDSALANELHGSRQKLEQWLGRSVTSFAYPRGRFDRRVRQAVIDAGYQSACATLAGLNRADTDAFLIRRIQVGQFLTPQALRLALSHGGDWRTRWRRSVRDRCVMVAAAWQGRDPLDLMLQPLRLGIRRT
jgi:peptidoglycan/xylan/chitin deacetylase (PgdA/CDA1 family)